MKIAYEIKNDQPINIRYVDTNYQALTNETILPYAEPLPTQLDL